MRHWAWALSARLTSRGDRSLFETMSANLRMNRQCRAAAWRARISAMAAAGSGSLSGGSGMDSPHAGGTIYSPLPIAIGILCGAGAGRPQRRPTSVVSGRKLADGEDVGSH